MSRATRVFRSVKLQVRHRQIECQSMKVGKSCQKVRKTDVKQLTIFALGVLMALGASAQTPLTATPIESNPKVRWFPIYARFAPDGSWVVVNLCSFHNPFYCRLVRWEPNGQPQTLEDGTPTTGRWTLIAGQEPNKSYIWPSVSWSGKKLAYVVADCPVKPPQPARSRPTGDLPSLPHALEKLHCSFYNGQPAISESTTDLKQGQQVVPIYSAARPAWRPDDQALLYWRTIGTARLASGRTFSQRDVYQYDFKSQVETPKFDRSVTKIWWDNEASGPFYAPNGKTFVLCGFWNGLSKADQFPLALTMYGCVETDAANPKSYRAMTRVDQPDYFTVAFADWKGEYWLVEQKNRLVLRNKATSMLSAPILSRVNNGVVDSNFSPVAAHISEAGDAAIVSQTLIRGMAPFRWSSYYYGANRDVPPDPLLSYYVAQTKELRPVFWPNVDQLN